MEPFDQFSWQMFAKGKWIIAAQANLIFSQCFKQEMKSAFIMHETIHPEFSEVFAWRCFVVNRYQVGSYLKPCSILPKYRERTTTMRESNASFGNCSNTPPKIREQIALVVSAGIPTNQGSQYSCVRFTHHIPGMNKEGAIHFFRSFKEGKNSFSPRFFPFTLVPISRPGILSPLCIFSFPL